MANDPPQFQAPGVFVTELPSQPRTIAGVDTAVPVFIGYTEIATVEGKPASLRARSDRVGDGVRGDVRRPLRADLPDRAGQPGESTTSRRSAGTRRAAPLRSRTTSFRDRVKGCRTAQRAELWRFNLHDSIRLFYANGGRRCFVVSVGARRGHPRLDRGAASKASMAGTKPWSTACGLQSPPFLLGLWRAGRAVRAQSRKMPSSCNAVSAPR